MNAGSQKTLAVSFKLLAEPAVLVSELGVPLLLLISAVDLDGVLFCLRAGLDDLSSKSTTGTPVIAILMLLKSCVLTEQNLEGAVGRKSMTLDLRI